MADGPQGPGPGRSTSDAAFKTLKKEVAERNEAAHKEAKKRRAPREQSKVDEKRRRDLL